MELSSSLVWILAAVFVLVVFGWFFLSRVRSVLLEKRDDQSLIMLQQQIEQLRAQFSQALEKATKR